MRHPFFRGTQTASLRALCALSLVLCISALSLAVAQPIDLSLQQAHETALKKNPKIIVADLQVLVAKQHVRQSHAAFYPSVHGNVTAVGTPEDRNNTLAAGALTTSSIYSRQADGFDVTQLITDFGRSSSLAATSKLHAQAQQQGAFATQAQILLAVDSAYFGALEAQSLLDVARQTVSTRQVVFDRVSEMAKNNLKSDLDATFAEVNLEDSKVLLADAENELQDSFALLSTLLGERKKVSYHLTDERLPAPASTNDWELVETALKNRPELNQLRFEREAAVRFASAERDLLFPTVTAFGAAGVLPIHNNAINNNYAAAGVNLRLPIFEGFSFASRRKEAALKAQIAVQNLDDAELSVIRDVRLAAMNQNYAAKRVALTARVAASTDKAYELANERFKVGSSSIIELSQAQLNQTQAKISETRARFELQLRNAALRYQLGQMDTANQPSRHH